ncbi:MAG: prepilin peptidase [Rhizobiaceae bacterium]|nr:prepilin peptidase [Rhizobiaceae bacterium]
MFEYFLMIFFPFLMIYSGASDLFSMTIPNLVSMLLISGFVVAAYAVGLDFSTILWHFIAFAVVLGFGFALFAIGQMGAGDVKLAASTALWFGWSFHLMEYILMFSIIGAIVTIAFIFARARFVPQFVGEVEWFVRLYNSNKYPYGLALGAAGLLVYPSTFWMQSIIV